MIATLVAIVALVLVTLTLSLETAVVLGVGSLLIYILMNDKFNRPPSNVHKTDANASIPSEDIASDQRRHHHPNRIPTTKPTPASLDPSLHPSLHPTPKAPSNAPEQRLTFPLLNEMEMRRVPLKTILPDPPQEDPLDEALHRQLSIRGHEPDYTTYYTKARTAHQRAVAAELSTRDPNIRPIGGHVGCKVALGTI